MTHLQPTLENELVLMRPIQIEDFDQLYHVASDPKIWELHQNSDRYELNVFKQFFKDALASKGAFVIIDKASETIIGSSRYKLHEQSDKAIEIGWTFLSREFWGGIYNKSFKTLMIDHAFTNFDYVLFNVDQHNFRSQKAVLNLGGVLIEKTGPLSYLHTTVETGLTFFISKSDSAAV